MDMRLAIGIISGLLAIWIAYRSRGAGPSVLPPPDKACDRNTVECANG
jgi:hypothetical protein